MVGTPAPRADHVLGAGDAYAVVPLGAPGVQRGGRPGTQAGVSAVLVRGRRVNEPAISEKLRDFAPLNGIVLRIDSPIFGQYNHT